VKRKESRQGDAPLALALLSLFLGTGCSLSIAEEPPFAFTTLQLYSREAGDGATDLVFRMGLENRSRKHVSAVRARANLYRDGAEPRVLFSVDTRARLSIAPGERATVEVVLNPLLYYDPGENVFLDGVTVAKLDYATGQPWRNPLGLFPYPERVPFGAFAPEEE
jgi:hypothetical protein